MTDPMREKAVYKDFTDFLNDKFYKANPMTLDDEWPDAYSEWLTEQDPDDLVKWADEYAKLQITAVARETITKISQLGGGV